MISLASMEAFRGINRRPLPGKAAVIADIIWRRKLTRFRHSADHAVATVNAATFQPCATCSTYSACIPKYLQASG
jgi:hypothetical protein